MANTLTSVRTAILNSLASNQLDKLLTNITNSPQLAPLLKTLKATEKPLSDIKAFIYLLLTHLPDKQLVTAVLASVGNYITTHPWETALLITAIILLVNPLAWVGFGAKGPIAHSLAAKWQGMIGAEVSKGSLFAVLQSIGMSAPGLLEVVGLGVVSAGAALEAFGGRMVKSKL